jgi:hypothetical protein
VERRRRTAAASTSRQWASQYQRYTGWWGDQVDRFSTIPNVFWRLIKCLAATFLCSSPPQAAGLSIIASSRRGVDMMYIRRVAEPSLCSPFWWRWCLVSDRNSCRRPRAASVTEKRQTVRRSLITLTIPPTPTISTNFSCQLKSTLIACPPPPSPKFLACI